MINSEENPASLFPVLLASTVHDIKTSLSAVLELMRQMALTHNAEFSDDFSQLEFETRRINHSLMHLLVMFKIDNANFDLDIDEYLATDILHEAQNQQDTLSKIKHIDLQIHCDDTIFCYCDFSHISNALGTVLNNALRYTRQRIFMSCYQENGFVVLSIEDDGDGYPEHFLHADFGKTSSLDWVHGNTGLGLYFVSVIAHFHHNKQHRGFVKIDNDSRYGGARFRLFLP